MPYERADISSPSNVQRADQLYQKFEKLGKGSFGEVYHGVEIETGKDVAIKILDLDINDDDLNDISKEISILSNCDSMYITRYHGAFLCGSKLWIIMDYAGGGSLRSIIKSGVFNEAAIGVIMAQVLNALVYLHKSASIIHRDIKAANILLTEDGSVKLCDFGVAGQLSQSILRRNSFVGTPYWISPEIIKRSQYDYKTDIWSLGITVIELATGNPPFSNYDPRQAILLIANSKPARLDGNFSVALKEFVALCLQEDPNDVSLTFLIYTEAFS
jgi:serine/threonine-protein kinase 24/25/MST4